jgi:hypothetical protein
MEEGHARSSGTVKKQCEFDDSCACRDDHREQNGPCKLLSHFVFDAVHKFCGQDIVI